ncbi:ATP-binding protein [Bacillus sp. JCM 19034]|uniref:ATP-binding protein n=1 Tax=Bacillus sp. JCM 19034 TaxID=1481928 RepID=UPI000781DF4E|nr:ATP-binding protein [Bacillus sp. JCM 19034]
MDRVKGSIFSLEGEWEYYDQQFVEPLQANQNEATYERAFERWPYTEDFQYGTYRLEVTIDEKDINQLLGIKLPYIYTSYNLYINGDLLMDLGQVADSASDYVGRIASRFITFTAVDTEMEILIHVAHDPVKNRDGGIYHPLEFGDGNIIQRQEMTALTSQIAVIFIFIVHGIYGLILYFIGPKQKVLIYFGILLLVASVSVMISDHRVILYVIPLEYVYISKLVFLSFSASLLLLMIFCKHLLPTLTKGLLFRLVPILLMFYCLFIIVAPIDWVLQVRFIFTVILVVVPAIVVSVFIRTVTNGFQDNIFILLGTVALMVHIVASVVQYNLKIDIDFYPIDFTLAVLLFSVYWFRRYFHSVEQTNTLSKQLQRALQSKDDFLANTSHELRNPLHGMINIAQTLLEKEIHSKEDKEDYKESLQLLISVGQRMSFLVNDLLEVNNLNENKITLQKKAVNLHAVLTGIIDILNYMLNGKEIRFQIEISPSFPHVLADENRLAQILFNLVHNAIKYTESGTITVSVELENNQAVIQITDTGIGITSEEYNRIFQRYEQGDSSMTAIGGGIGLGLSITKQLIELHGGIISVQSIKEKGTTFSFTLPIAKQEHHASNLAANNKPMENRSMPTTINKVIEQIEQGKILIVDDDPINIKIVEDLLQPLYSTYGVTSGCEALEHLKQSNWDLIITDVMMPNMSGYELTKQIRKTFLLTELPILVLTARSQAEDIETAFLAGANDYVTKPVHVQELRSRVTSLIRVKKTVEENIRIETAWLQAQIQPHFFFNTLNAILSLAEINIERMKQLLEAFCHYLQTSFQFNNTNGLVSLESEINFVQSYVHIMQERSHFPFDVIWEVEDDVEKLKIPPFSIQPLVENAIEHGLTSDRKGEITITITTSEDETTVMIRDNGQGMSKEKINQLLNRPETTEKRGIGLYNVNRRILQLTGKGLTIQSEEGSGTCIEFHI